ncbi:MAG TPA: hypothetical protein VL996_13915 [Methylocella sp.]|nr:hypothetical protein [Methylocella sp.]
MSEDWKEKIAELHRDIQRIDSVVMAIAADLTQNRNLTLANSHYLEEVAEMVKTLENKCPGVDAKHQ